MPSTEKKLILCWLWEKKITILHSSKLELSQMSKKPLGGKYYTFVAVLVDKMTFTYNINVESISYIGWVDSSIQEKFVFNEVRLNRLYFDKSLFSWQGRIHKTLQGIAGTHHKHKLNSALFIPVENLRTRKPWRISFGIEYWSNLQNIILSYWNIIWQIEKNMNTHITTNDTGCLKKLSFTELSICRFAMNIISISSQLTASGSPHAWQNSFF